MSFTTPSALPSSAPSRSEIPQIDRLHFGEWKDKMNDYFRRHDMWECVFSTNQLKRKTAPNQEKTFAFLCQAIQNDDLLYQSEFIREERKRMKPSPRKVWKFIKEQVQPTHDDALVHLEMKINSITLLEGETIPKLLSRFNELTACLPRAAQLKDQLKIRHIKRAIASNPTVKANYDTEIRAIMVSGNVTYVEFSNMLLRRYEELKYEEEQEVV